MKEQPAQVGHPARVLYFCLLSALLFFSFYRPELFFYLDEYIHIWHLAETPSVLRFALLPSNEHFQPLFKLFYAVEVRCFGERYVLYVLTNILLLSAAGLLWSEWLRRLDIPVWISWSVPLIAFTSACQSENVMWGFQSAVMLSALALLGVLFVYTGREVRHRVAALAISCVCGAFTFGNLYVLPLVLAADAVFDWHSSGRRNRGLLVRGSGFAGLFACLTACSLWMAQPFAFPTSHFWTGGVRRLLWIAWYTLSVAFYGPLAHLVLPVVAGPAAILTLLSLAFALGLIAISWKTTDRGLVIKLLVLQLALFVLIAPFRNTPPHVGFAGHYYTAGMIPLLSAAAIACRRVLEGHPRRTLMASAVLLVAAMAQAVRWCQHDDWELAQYGRAAHVDYYQTKQWLVRHRNEVVADHDFNQSVAPWLHLDQLIPIMATLDPSFISGQPVLKPARYIENLANDRPWGPITDGQSAAQTFAAQTFKVDKPSVLTKLELLVSRSDGFTGMGDISIWDGGTRLWQTVIDGRSWPMNRWLAVPVDLAPLSPGRTYTIRVGTRAKAGEWLTVWINQRPESYSCGETRTPDGVSGDFCFRLALMDP